MILMRGVHFGTMALTVVAVASIESQAT